MTMYPDRDRGVISGAKTNWQELYAAAVTQNNIDRLRIVNINFKSITLTADTPVDLWNVNEATRSFISTPETITVVSDNVNDTSAGTGAQTVLILGLDDNGDYQEEVVSLNGLTPVTTTLTFSDFRRCDIRDTGNNDGTNTGIITFSGTTSGNTLGQMDAGEGITTNSHFTVPNGFNAYFYSMNMSISQPGGTSIKEVEVKLKNRWTTDNNKKSLFVYPFALLGTRGTGLIEYNQPMQAWSLSPGVESWITVESATNSTHVFGNMQMLLIKEGAHDDFY